MHVSAESVEHGRKPRLTYTLDEAAEQLSISRRYLDVLVDRGEILRIRPGRGRSVCIRHTELVRYLDELEAEEKALRARVAAA